MKKILFILIAFLAISLSQAVTVEREMVSAIDFGDTLTITFAIDPEDSTSFEFTDAVPTEWKFVNWDVQGISKENVVFTYTQTTVSDNSKEIYKWRFENATGLITLTYDVNVKTAGEEKLTALWVVGSGIESEDSTIVVRSTGMVCGNAICETAYGENPLTCPSDCLFKMNVFFWLGLLLIATVIAISGLYYREYKKIKPMQKPMPKGPVQVIKFELKERPKEIPRVRTVRESPKQKTVKSVKKKAKKTLKKEKKKKTKQKIQKKAPRKPAKNKSEKMYKETLSRLNKIKNELRT